MTEQEYVRKYMLKDIVRRNMRFIWLIVLCAIVFAGGLGYKKYSEYQTRFYKMSLKGTLNRYTVEYYSGNVIGEALSIRTQSLISVMTSRETYDELVRLSGYPVTYDSFLELVICDTDGTKDCVSAMLEYPYGSDEFSITDDAQALSYMNYYMQAVENTCSRVIGKDSIYRLGRSDITTHVYEASSEQKSAANKAVIKNAFIGAVIGFIIPVVIITLIYLFGGKLRTAPEIAFCAGFKLLAELKKGNTAQLNQVVLYLEKHFADTKEGKLRINIINLNDGGDNIAQELRNCFAASGQNDAEIVSTRVSEDNSEVIRTAQTCNVNLLAAACGQVTQEDIDKLVRTMALFEIEGNGVIVYEPAK